MVSRAADPELVRRARRGEGEAFDELVRRHQGRAVTIASRFLGDTTLAHDAAQEAFIAAWRALPRFRGDAHFGTWLYRILYNTCLDHAKRRGREPQPLGRGGEQEDAQPEPEPRDTAPLPDARVEQSELQETVQAALSRLDEKHRAVLVFFDIEGLSYEEIGEILRLPLGTVKSRLNRARHALRRELTPMWEQTRRDAGLRENEER